MTFNIVRFNGHVIRDATFDARMYTSDVPLARAVATAYHSPDSRYPEFTSFDEQVHTIAVTIIVKTGFQANQFVLMNWFKPGTVGPLVMDVDGVERNIMVVVKHIVPFDKYASRFTVALEAADDWKSEQASVTTALTASPGLVTVTHTGSAAERRPVLRIRPYTLKAAASAYTYSIPVIIANRAPFALPNYAVEILGGYDHADEVTSVRSLATGADVRVLRNGVEVPRWPSEVSGQGFNSTGLRLFINGDFAAGQSVSAIAAMTTTSPSNGEDLEIVKGGSLKLPERGAAIFDNELILYSGKTENNINGRAALRNIVRAGRRTTAAAHSALAVGWFVEHDYDIIFGYLPTPTLAVPDARDDVKPLLDLSAAGLTNSQLEWAQFADDTNPGRSMPWRRALTTEYPGYGSVLEGTGSPLPAMGSEYRFLGPIADKPNRNIWSRAFPTGLAISATSVYRGVDSGNFSAQTTLTRTKVTGTAADDFLVTAINWNVDPGTVTVPAGWTEIATQNAGASYLRVYTRIAVAAEPATYVWTWTNSAYGSSVTYAAHDAYAAEVLVQGTNASTDVFPANTTPTLSPSVVLAIGGKENTGGFTPPTGFTERFEASAIIGLTIDELIYTAAKNERVLLTSDAGPSGSGTYAIIMLKMSGPIRYERTIADSLALVHRVTDKDGNLSLAGYEFGGSGSPVTIATYNFTGAAQTFVVPAGVTEIFIDASGAKGANGSAVGGSGARVTTRLTVTPAESLQVNVGGMGSGSTGGFNGGGAGGATGVPGGGGGGGASDIRQGGTANADRKVIAAGGGGGGSNGSSGSGAGNGGGGNTVGNNGAATSLGGQPGATGAGGAGGTGGAFVGSAGSIGQGGAGGNSSSSGSGPGGGGGGGKYGGGGGAGDSDFDDGENHFYYGGAGGGGGHSESLGTQTTIINSSRTGDGLVLISYVAANSNPAVRTPYSPVSLYEHQFTTVSPVVARPPTGSLAVQTATMTATTIDQAQQFQAGDEVSYLANVRLTLDSVATGASRIEATVYVDSSDTPGLGIATSKVTVAAVSAVPQEVNTPFSPIVPLIPGKKYWIGWRNIDAASTTASYQYVNSPYPYKAKIGGTVYALWNVFRFMLSFSPENLDSLDGSARSDELATVAIDNVRAYLNTAQTPLTVRGLRAQFYYANTFIRNILTGQTLKLNGIPLNLGDVVEIDPWRRAVRNLSTGPFALAFTGGVVENLSAQTVTIAAGRITMAMLDKGVFSEEQGWLAYRFNVNWANTTATARTLFDWRVDANNRITVDYDTSAADAWRITRVNGGSTDIASTAAQTFSANSDHTLVVAWERGQVKISVNGITFVTTAGSDIPNLLSAVLADIGSVAGATWFDADFYWAVFGKGILTTADSAALHAIGNTKPDFDVLRYKLLAEALPTVLWNAYNNRIARVDALEFDKGQPVSHLVTPSSPERWFELLPGTNDLYIEEAGLVGETIEVRSANRFV